MCYFHPCALYLNVHFWDCHFKLRPCSNRQVTFNTKVTFLKQLFGQKFNQKAVFILAIISATAAIWIHASQNSNRAQEQLFISAPTVSMSSTFFCVSDSIRLLCRCRRANGEDDLKKIQDSFLWIPQQVMAYSAINYGMIKSVNL